jgi:hypothetical protein
LLRRARSPAPQPRVYRGHAQRHRPVDTPPLRSAAENEALTRPLQPFVLLCLEFVGTPVDTWWRQRAHRWAGAAVGHNVALSQHALGACVCRLRTIHS